MSIFSKSYWKQAAAPFSDIRWLCMAAVFIALRVAVDAVSIQLGPDLYISVSFLSTALGSSLYGPLMGLACGAITDTISALLFPKGAYFFPFIFVEMVGGFLFGLFLWRQKTTPTRVILSKLSVTFFCNILLNTGVLYWMYAWLGNPKTSLLFALPRLIKNLVLFPAECVLMILLFNALLPGLQRMGLTFGRQDVDLHLRWYHYLLMAAMLPLAAVLIYLYYAI